MQGGTIENDDTQQSDNEGFDGLNAPRKKRKLQTPAGREQDYDDIRFSVRPPPSTAAP